MVSVEIMSVPIHSLRMEEAAARAADFLRSKNSHMIMTPNAEILYAASRNHSLKENLMQADMRVADGSGLLWAARFLGNPLPERVAGIDLMYRLLDIAAKQDTRVFFLGSRGEVVQSAKKMAEERWPGIHICGIHHGYFAPEQEPDVLQRIMEAEPELLCVGMGAPRQEEWMVRNRDGLKVPLMIGVGGSFDVLAGYAVRAPDWMQRVGLEWLFRFLHEPKRFRRMAMLPLFIGAVVKEKYWVRRHVGNHEK